ncbi:MAG: hypothetical protein H6658_02810 [Ardenticatenaceae bacterium]|nr:hypothetical protein [Ardenticatenaceae bacterium]
MMDLFLHRVCVRLACEAQVVQRYWQQLFADWQGDGVLGVMAQLELELVEELPVLPEVAPFFVDQGSLPDDVGLLSVYGLEGGAVLLHYWEGALVRLPLAAERPFLTGHVLTKAMGYGRLEDITFTSLAPFLRRQGYFLLHAFGVHKDGRCLLFVGASGSGKTTTGLSLLLAGWELLANDILLLERREDGVYALPTPGGLSIREGTLALLPDCGPLVAHTPCVQGKYSLTNQWFWRGHVPEAAKVTAVYFCQVEERVASAERPLSRAIAFAQLMEQSIDRWDENMLVEHITVLQHLSQQAECFTLHLGRDVPQIPALLTNKP